MTKVQLITKNLGLHLLEKLEQASTVCILTSFVMKSGVLFLKEALKKAAENGSDIKICSGDYLFVSQPEALEELLLIDDRIEIRLWKSNGVSFHPKAYLFQTETQEYLFVGSSNLSHSALVNGVEWNLVVSDEKEVYAEAQSNFLEAFYSEQTVPMNPETLEQYKDSYANYHKNYPDFAKKWSQQEELNLMLPTKSKERPQFIADPPVEYGQIQPRFAQLEALEELEKTMAEEYSKALVVMATGLGKTYLAGFFARNFQRVLFIAHREELLNQAMNSFVKIMPDKQYGIYNGKVKEKDADAIFASIYTLSLKTHLERFKQDEFDLIIVDEFHHAAAATYKRVLDYFYPKFLLGITATPDRNDNKDVYAICNGNVAYRIDFLQAIERKWLSPFHYYGIYDDTDYSQITWLGSRYDGEELLKAQLRDELAEKIFLAWKNKKQTRTIGFCSSIKQANYLSKYFNQQGYRSVSIHSQQVEIGRQQAIDQLSDGVLDILFTVDLFNEGIDIPVVDTLLFVRPTESLTVYTQQIGRGLRLHPGKKACVIIDLIGNYRNADVKLSIFDTVQNKKKRQLIQPSLPEFCQLNLDLKVIHLLEEMTRKKQPRKEKLLNDYLALKRELGRRPTYLELHLQGASNSPIYRQEYKSYIGFLKWANELSDQEADIFTRFEQWLIEVERTVMTKSYKMILLLAMLERGISDWYKPVSSKKIAPFFHQYLMEKEYRKRIDFSDSTAKKLWTYNEISVSKLVASMPMTKWSGSSDDLVTYENDLFTFQLNVAKSDEEILFNWTKEICEYRLHFHFERKGNKSALH